MPRRDVLTPQGEKGLPSLSRRMGVCTTPMPRSLTALLCPISRSGARQAVAHCGRWLPEALRLLGLGALLAILGALALAGCYISRTIDQATASDVNNRNFTFTSGEVFHPALQNVATGLVFSNNAQNFTLCSGSNNTATGTNRFGSCTLTVTLSNYSSGAGPQVNDVIKLDPCDFDSDNHTLTVSNRGITTTSAAATMTTDTGCSAATQAMTSQVNNQRFTFTDGGVFDTALTNVQTTLAFSNNAQNFTLSSAGAVSVTASGTSSVIAGSCSLTVTKRDDTSNTGPRVGTTIRLNPCTYNSSNNTLTVTSATGMATSQEAILQ